MKTPRLFRPFAKTAIALCFGLSSVFMTAQEASAHKAPKGISHSTLSKAWSHALQSGQAPLQCQKVKDRKAYESPIIVLDLGHRYQESNGRIKTGASSKKKGRIKEADIIDAVGSALQKELTSRGIDVVMTREPGQPIKQGTKGKRKLSLSVRGHLPIYLSDLTKRPTMLVSLHVDSVRSGGVVYTQNRVSGDSENLAKEIAKSYKIGSRKTIAERHSGSGWFQNRMLRNFESLDKACRHIDAQAVLIEMGNLNDSHDLRYLKKWHNGDAAAPADMIADGVEAYAKKKYNWQRPEVQYLKGKAGKVLNAPTS